MQVCSGLFPNMCMECSRQPDCAGRVQVAVVCRASGSVAKD